MTTPLITWDETISIGVQEIDDQHKRLLDLLNDVHQALESSCTHEEIGAALRRLCDYTVDHFAAEEALMDVDIDAYAEYDQHLSEHMQCTTVALDFLQTYSEGKDVDMPEFLRFVATWIREHILQVDKTLGVFLLSRQAAS